ncbi:Transposase (fragment) [Mycobacteroides abscessus subsp. abscessus]
MLDRVASRFARCEPLRNAGALMLGLVCDIDRKNCWTLAERCGHSSPDRMQHLLARAKWDAEGVRDDLRAYVVDHLGDDEAILIVDETGDVKKGTHTVGTQRQYTGTAGRIENAQVAVYLAYAGPNSHALVDRELYLPKSWIDDSERRQCAGVPTDVEFATKPALAERMITRAVAAGVPARWATGDEVYGADPDLRAAIAAQGLGYVPAVGSNRTVTTSTGSQRVDELARSLPRRAWRRVSAGTGAKGQRWYSWTLVEITDAEPGHHHLLVRRNDKTAELAYYRCYSPNPVTLADYVRVAGRRWKVEESFQAGKGLAGLDEHQVRTWTSWHRWVTLSMLAHAFLVVTTAAQRRSDEPDDQTGQTLITLTVNEFRRLFIALVLQPLHAVADVLAWSTWRRRHQTRARTYHYRKQHQQQ